MKAIKTIGSCALLVSGLAFANDSHHEPAHGADHKAEAKAEHTAEHDAPKVEAEHAGGHEAAAPEAKHETRPKKRKAAPINEFGSEPASAIKPLDSVLDRLEKRILQNESDAMTFGEKNLPEQEPAQKIKLPKAEITAEPDEESQLTDVARAVAQLNNEIDRLNSNVQKTKQQVMTTARAGNTTTVELHLDDADSAALRSLSVRLNGFEIYTLNDTAGLWMPQRRIPIYIGPLKPGNHKIEVEGQLVIRNNKDLPTNTDVYRSVHEAFNLAIPDTKQQSRFVIDVQSPTDSEGNGRSAKAALRRVL